MEKILGGWKYFTNVLYMRYFLYILSLECLMVLGFFSVKHGLHSLSGIRSGCCSRLWCRCPIPQTMYFSKSNNTRQQSFPTSSSALFVSDFLFGFILVSQRYLSSRIQLCKRILWRYETTLKHTIKSYQYYSMTFFWK